MPYLLVRQKVEDYNKWYKVFKSHEKTQKEAGFKDLQLLRDVSDPNTIVCIFRVDDLEKELLQKRLKRVKHKKSRE